MINESTTDNNSSVDNSESLSPNESTSVETNDNGNTEPTTNNDLSADQKSNDQTKVDGSKQEDTSKPEFLLPKFTSIEEQAKAYLEAEKALTKTNQIKTEFEKQLQETKAREESLLKNLGVKDHYDVEILQIETEAAQIKAQLDKNLSDGLITESKYIESLEQLAVNKTLLINQHQSTRSHDVIKTNEAFLELEKASNPDFWEDEIRKEAVAEIIGKDYDLSKIKLGDDFKEYLKSADTIFKKLEARAYEKGKKDAMLEMENKQAISRMGSPSGISQGKNINSKVSSGKDAINLLKKDRKAFDEWALS